MAQVIIAVAIMVATYWYAQEHKPNPPDDPVYKRVSRGHLVNTTSTDEPMRRIYGCPRVGVNWVYKGVSGADARYLHMVGNIGEGPIDGVVQVEGVDQIWLNDKLASDPVYTGKVYYEIFTGTADQMPCATLHAAIPEWNEAKRNTAYIYLRVEYDPDVFQSTPDVTLQPRGLKIYNPDTNVTEYSDNAALCAYDYMTASARRGGMGIARARFDTASIVAAAAYCTAKGWTCNIPIDTVQAAADNLAEILACFRGDVIYSASTFRMRYRDLNYESPAIPALTEKDIVMDSWEGNVIVEQPDDLPPNAVRIQFLNKEKKYQLDDYVFTDNDALATDAYREETVKIRGIDTPAKARMFAAYWLERLRINKTVLLPACARAKALEPLDLVPVTLASKGWTNKLFRVLQCPERPDGNVSLSLVEEESMFYDDTYNIAEHNWHDTNLPSATDTVQSVRGVSQSEEVYYYRNRSFTRWKINFSMPDPTVYPFADYVEIWIKLGEAGDWKYMTRSRGNYQLDPVNEGATYFCRMVVVSIHGRKEPFASAYTVSRYIEGKTSSPTDMSAISGVASGDTVTLIGDPITDPDIDGYEIRIGESFQGGIFFDFKNSPLMRLSGVKPGQFTFWMSPKDNGGRYSENPVSATVDVLYPAGYVDKNTWSWDFSVGTFVNVEQTTYGGNNCLKCSHSGSVLNGKWTSPEYDLGSIKTVRVWGDFLIDFAAPSLTWDGIIPVPETWADIDISRTWADIFGAVASGKVKAKLEWGTTSGIYFGSAEFFQVLAPEFTARYVRVTVEITDPAADANTYLRTLSMKAAYWS